jgi:membrane protein YqaA with SNARE-associated domain
MAKVVAFIGATLGGALGWWLGASFGVFTALVLSTVGTGAGIYYSRRWLGKYLP